jgi:hypothetical protein
MLAVQMEFNHPKNLLLSWTLPTLKTLTETFAKIDYTIPGAALASEDMLSYRRVFAKFRRLGYFVSDLKLKKKRSSKSSGKLTRLLVNKSECPRRRT